jgi:hypothetical protein
MYLQVKDFKAEVEALTLDNRKGREVARDLEQTIDRLQGQLQVYLMTEPSKI